VAPDPRRAKRKIDWFVLALGVAIGLAWLIPSPGAEGGWLHGDFVKKGGVALIFFLHGAALSLEAIRAGTLRWPLHVLVQSATFLVFPLLGLAGIALLGDRIAPDLRLGLFFLCALPSTVSSSVAMTAIAHGNVPAAVFNATFSSVIGVFLTPLWIAWVMKTSGAPLPLGGVVLDLVIWLILPLIAGHLLRPWLARPVHQHKKFVHLLDRGVILLLVYTSFCESFASGTWEGRGAGILLVILGISAVLFFVVMALLNGICRVCRFPVEDRITAIFCGSKKSMASGVPMAQIMFAGHPGLSLILLPIIIYHAFQLVVCAWLAKRWGERDGHRGD